MKLLIDGDVQFYRAAFATQYSEYGSDDFGWFRHKRSLDQHLAFCVEDEDLPSLLPTLTKREVIEPETAAIQVVDSILNNLARKYSGAEMLVCVSGDKNFRKDVKYPVLYKGNRPPKPKHFYAVKSHVRANYNCICFDHLEADDVIGIMATKDPNCVIVTIDKDLDQIPGLHYNPVTDEEYTVKYDEGIRYLYEQMLSGDRVDNIIGLSGIGPVKATKMLAGCSTAKEMEDVVRRAYAKEWEGGADEMYEANMKLLKILRHEDTNGVNPSKS